MYFSWYLVNTDLTDIQSSHYLYQVFRIGYQIYQSNPISNIPLSGTQSAIFFSTSCKL
jgi:hypothetical protein